MVASLVGRTPVGNRALALTSLMVVWLRGRMQMVVRHAKLSVYGQFG